MTSAGSHHGHSLQQRALRKNDRPPLLLPASAAGPAQVRGPCAVLPAVLGAVCEARHQCQEGSPGSGHAAAGPYPVGAAGFEGWASLQLPSAGALPPHFQVCCAAPCCAAVVCCAVLQCNVFCCALLLSCALLLWYAVLRRVLLCFAAALCLDMNAVLCCARLRCAWLLRYAMLCCCGMLCCDVFCCALLLAAQACCTALRRLHELSLLS